MKPSTILILMALPSFWSCVDDIDAGPIISQNRDLKEYDELEVNDAFEVAISADFDFDLRITAPDNLMPYIDTYVVGNRLIIDERENRVDHESILIEISETALTGIQLDGSGSILSEDTIYAELISVDLDGSGTMGFPVSCSDLQLRLDGSGNIEAQGKALRITSRIDGSGSINSRSIESAHSDAGIDGSGIIDTYTAESLVARINGSGVIRYWGQPSQVDALVNGSGKITKIN